MKRTFAVLLDLLLLAVPVTVQAQFQYTTNANQTLTITGYSGTDAAVIIPSAINNLPVTSIGPGAFNNRQTMVSVNIPGSITNVGGGAFVSCWSMTAINVDPTNMFYTSLDGVLFDKQQTTLIEFPGGLFESYTIPGTVTSIGASAFAYCAGVTDLIIPNSVTNFGSNAFMTCSGLTSVTIPGSITNLGAGTFAGCDSLTSVYFQGNSPFIYLGTFGSDYNATLYYMPGTSGWSSPLDGRPVVMLNAPDPDGTLQVFISPAGANAAGAQWQVDGGVPQTNGAVVLGMAASNHSVSFSTINGWTTPANLMVTVNANTNTITNATYVQQSPLLIQTTDGNFGMQGNQFGFDITGPANLPIVVEACNSLASNGWTPLQTLTLTNGLFYFSEPAQANTGGRYYRVSSP